MDLKIFAVATTVLLALAASVPAPVSGQAVATSCAESLVTSFASCLGYITNSTNGGRPLPTADGCRCLAAVVNASTSCACLILAGHVPLSIPVNWTLALTLPKACNSISFPLRCEDTSAQSPAPGPVAVSPAMPPLSPMAPFSPAPAPTAEPTVTTPPSSQSQRQTTPQVVPSSAWRASAGVSVMLAVVGAMLG